MNMKYSIYLLLVISIGIVCLWKPDSKNETEKFENKHRPFESFYFQRSYPEMVYDINAYNQSLNQIKEQFEHQKISRLGNSGLLSDWKQEGPTNIGGRLNAIEAHPANPNII